MQFSISVKFLSLIGLGLFCALPAIARMDGPSSGTGQDMVLHLGEVDVHGERNVTLTLQAIKVALTRPLSNDPKLANVMVCRMEDEAGSHIKQELVCGTNRTLSMRRASLQLNYMAATAQNTRGVGCYDSVCYSAVFDQLNETIQGLPGRYLDQSVNGPALHNALQKVPMPVPDLATQVQAPSAASKQ